MEYQQAEWECKNSKNSDWHCGRECRQHQQQLPRLHHSKAPCHTLGHQLGVSCCPQVVSELEDTQLVPTVAELDVTSNIKASVCSGYGKVKSGQSLFYKIESTLLRKVVF